MGKMTLLTGGARSGKSTLAEKIAAETGGEILFIATAQALDKEMERRIQLHQESRPEDWKSLEIGENLASVLAKKKLSADLIIIDCITMLVSNVILKHSGSLDEPDEEAAEDALDQEISSLISYIQKSNSTFILVSNDVGMGLVPPYPVGRLYRDLMGRVNRQLALVADEVYWINAGFVLPLHELGTHLDQDRS